MEHEWEGPCGLKPRLALAFNDVADLNLFAEYLDVTPDVAWQSVFNPAFTPTPDDLATMWANLPLVANLQEHHRKLGAGQGRDIYIWESSLWTPAAIDNLPLSTYTREFAWVF